MSGLTQNWTVVAFKEGKTEPNPHGGQLTKFYVHFMGEDGTDSPDTYWRRKAGSIPEINKPVWGTISEGQYGPIFKLVPRDTQAPISTPQQVSQEGVRVFTPDTERQRRIERQHSQEMALRLIEATRDAGDLDLTNPDMVSTYLNEVVRKLTDWFVRDLEKR